MLVLMICLLMVGTVYFLTVWQTKKMIKQSEDKIWDYLKLKDITKPVNTSSGLTRKF